MAFCCSVAIKLAPQQRQRYGRQLHRGWFGTEGDLAREWKRQRLERRCCCVPRRWRRNDSKWLCWRVSLIRVERKVHEHWAMQGSCVACRLFDLRYIVWICLLIPTMYVSSRRSVQFQFTSWMRTRLRFASIAETGGGSGSVWGGGGCEGCVSEGCGAETGSAGRRRFHGRYYCGTSEGGDLCITESFWDTS
jgi:hypothetical protein